MLKFFESNPNILKHGCFNHKDTNSNYECRPTTYWGQSTLNNGKIFQGCVHDVFAGLYNILLGSYHKSKKRTYSRERCLFSLRKNLSQNCSFFVVEFQRATFKMFLKKVIELGAIYTGHSWAVCRLLYLGFVEEAVQILKTMPHNQYYSDVSNGLFFLENFLLSLLVMNHFRRKFCLFHILVQQFVIYQEYFTLLEIQKKSIKWLKNL